MRKLQILPGNIANMIAAGEVVQRPSSVVKELVENAVDAGADSITVVVTDSGRTLIQVIDNGCGMSADDAILCFERHATSKIATAEDLENILTYGFRGEALASIAAVAEVTLVTRRSVDETATKVKLDGFNHVSTSSVSAPVGSNFSVRNLFYNTPARRKFLKSDSAELRHIVEEFTHIALTRPGISFTLTHNGREMFVLKKAKSLKFRVLDILGGTVTSDLLEVGAQTSIVNVSGFVGQPSTARKSASGQFFFVNGRFFRSPYFHKAVAKACEDFIPDGTVPPYIIFLETDPRSIDVNISPTKTEIKFEEDSVVFQTIYACLKEAFGKNAFGSSIDFDTEGAVDIPVFGSNFDEFHPVGAPSSDLDPSYNPFDADTPTREPASGRTSQSEGWGYNPSRAVDHIGSYGALFEEKGLPSAQQLVLQGKYIAAPSATGLMLVNIRRARERVLYERFLEAFSKETHVVQQSLFPLQIKIGVENRLIFDDNATLLARMGFDIAPFGNDTIVVNGVPEGYSCESGKVALMVEDLARILSDEDRDALPQMMAQNMAQKFASLGASTSSSVSGGQEARKLMEDLLGCSNSEFTASGHRIISVLNVDELEKRFK